MNACKAIGCAILCAVSIVSAALADPPKVKSVYLTTIDGSKYCVTQFQRLGNTRIIYQVSPDLVTWLTPGVDGAPKVVAPVDSKDPLTSYAHVDQPVTAANRYFLRATGLSQAPMDFDGDGKSDFVIVRNTGGGAAGQITWYIADQKGGKTQIPFGIASDRFVPADYDGDGICDLALYRPGTVGQFLIRQSSTGTVRTVNLGTTGDDPTVIADYDGDGKTEPAVFRAAATATDQCRYLYVGSLNNPGGATTTVSFKTGTGYFPDAGDFDGDGKADLCVQGPNGSSANFYLRRSSDNMEETVTFGVGTDVVIQGDFGGDDRSDFAVARSSGGSFQWYTLTREGGGTGTTPITLGASATDYKVPGDYDGDGKQDIAVWKPIVGQGNPIDYPFYKVCAFTVRRSSDGATQTFTWGLNGDYPVAAYQTH